METLLGNVTTFVTQGVAWIGQVVDVIVGEPFLILMCIAVPLSGWAIGAIKRLTRI